jgi:hypothetical protein
VKNIPILKCYGCTKASIVDGVLGSFVGLALDGDDWTLGMLDAELAHRAHENPATKNTDRLVQAEILLCFTHKNGPQYRSSSEKEKKSHGIVQ